MLYEPGQTTTTLCNISKCCMKNLTIFKFEPITLNTSQHVGTGWPNACNMLRPTMLRYVAFKCCDRLAGACNVVMCFAEMLRSFGRRLARSRLSVCGDDRKRGRATSGIREKKAEGGPSLISPRPRSSPAHFFDHPH